MPLRSYPMPVTWPLTPNAQRLTLYVLSSALIHNLIDQAVLQRLLGRHKVVAIHVTAYLIVGLPRVFGQDLVQAIVHPHHLFKPDLGVLYGAFIASGDSMDHDAGVRQRIAFAC